MKLKQTDGDVKSDTKMKTVAILTKKLSKTRNTFKRDRLNCP